MGEAAGRRPSLLSLLFLSAAVVRALASRSLACRVSLAFRFFSVSSALVREDVVVAGSSLAGAWKKLVMGASDPAAGVEPPVPVVLLGGVTLPLWAGLPPAPTSVNRPRRAGWRQWEGALRFHPTPRDSQRERWEQQL